MNKAKGGESPFLLPQKKQMDAEALRRDEEALSMLPKVIEGENDVITESSRAHFGANLFDVRAIKDEANKHAREMWGHEFDPQKPTREQMEYVDMFVEEFSGNLRESFLELLLECSSMEDRLALFLHEDFLPYVNSLDLGKTDEADHAEFVQYLVLHYRYIRGWLADQDKIEDELPREESGRSVYIRHDAHMRESDDPRESQENIATPWRIGVRNRPLIRFEENGYEITITKRMTFALQVEFAEQFADAPDGPANPEAHGFMEQLMNEKGPSLQLSSTEQQPVTDERKLELLEHLLDVHDPIIKPIRTLYYVTRRKIKTPQAPVRSM